MLRQSRIDAYGALHHVIGREIARKKIFFDDKGLDIQGAQYLSIGSEPIRSERGTDRQGKRVSFNSITNMQM